MKKLLYHFLLLCLLASLAQGYFSYLPYYKKSNKQYRTSTYNTPYSSYSKSKKQSIKPTKNIFLMNYEDDFSKKSSSSQNSSSINNKSKHQTQKTSTNKTVFSQVNNVSQIVKQGQNTKINNIKQSAQNDYKTDMALMISQLVFIDTPQNKKLQNQLTNELFAIYNTLNKIGNKNINQALYKNNLKKQVDQFLLTLDKIQKIGAASTASSDSSILLGTDNILIGESSIVEGDNNKVRGNNTLIIGKNNLISGNSSITSGGQNIVIGNNSFVVGHNNTASGNNTYVFARNSQVAKNNSLVVANYTIDLNQLNSKNTKLKNVLSSSKGKK